MEDSEVTIVFINHKSWAGIMGSSTKLMTAIGIGAALMLLAVPAVTPTFASFPVAHLKCSTNNHSAYASAWFKQANGHWTNVSVSPCSTGGSSKTLSTGSPVVQINVYLSTASGSAYHTCYNAGPCSASAGGTTATAWS